MGIKKEARLRGRFKEEIDDAVMRYVASVPFDWRLYRYDIEGSIAHAEMLARQKIITQQEFSRIKYGLISIVREIETGDFQFKTQLEDVHMNIESRLFEKIGEIAGKLHTARSRNDQVALDMRLYARDSVLNTLNSLLGLCTTLVSLAEKRLSVIMPGYTHLQQAQPVLFSHYLLAYFEMFNRDIERFNSCLSRINVLSLGSGALAGVPYPIDREFVAGKLGFTAVSANSLDAVSDRDFILEYESAAAIVMVHLSRLAEEVILWSTKEFGFIEIGDSYATSSSIMPQKKNPDTAELARGKAGRVFGHLIGMLTVLKGLPLAYNRDLQEDKEGFFDTVDTLVSTLDIMSGLIASISLNEENMASALSSHVLATDVADYLVHKGLSFREAHSIVSRLVAYALENNRELNELTLAEYKKFSRLFSSDIKDLRMKKSIEARQSTGGTATAQVKASIKRARAVLKGYEARKS
jgi:argininosuccinate lyase